MASGRRSETAPSAVLPVRRLQRAVLEWYARHQRPLTWRSFPPEPYAVLVREVMLQQTQAGRVERALERFLERFPSFQSLAAASLAEVLQCWQGLGYNLRARRLWECARTVVSHYGGQLPQEPSLLQRLPGIGPYTAAAVATFAFGRQDLPVVDTNVRRVLQRLVGEELPQQVVEHARRLIPRGKSAEWHQALMDIGALLCRPRSPRCGECPLQQWCQYARNPVPSVPAKRVEEPSFEGIPRRLWRGRVLRIVATQGKASLRQVAQMLFGQIPTAQQRLWVRHVVQGLVRDGLLVRSGGMLCLPRGA